MKHFNHKLVPEFELSDEIIDGKRFYTLHDGTKLKSVTTVLGEKLDKSALLKWREAVGDEEADKIGRIAAARGSILHNLNEALIRNEVIDTRRVMPFHLATFHQFRKELEKHVDDILGIELPLASKALGVAGRTDLVARWDGVPSIIDYKTSKRLKEEDWIESYFLQTTIYSLMFEWTYKIKIPQIVVLIAVDHENDCQVFIKERALYVNRVLELLVDN